MPPLKTTLLPGQNGDVLELDEVWSFVQAKAKERWLWLAMCRRTRQIVAFFVGDRSKRGAKALRAAIPQGYRARRTRSDTWRAYKAAFDPFRHQSVGGRAGATNHLERWNLTLCQRLGRFVRKTLSFSKSETMHRAAIALFIHAHNLSVIS